MTYHGRDGNRSEEGREPGEESQTVTLRISLERKRKACELASHHRISLSRLVEKLLDDYTEPVKKRRTFMEK
jgi:predicted HicB family RNase H-like nuclease